MGNVITITREFGSMGREIARIVSKKMNYQYYDRDIIELTAKELRENIDELSAFEDKKIPIFQKMMYPLGRGTSSMQNKIYEMEKSIIIDLASSDNCVMVGRCADYILHECNHSSMLSTFIYAPRDTRIISCENELGLSQGMAEDYVRKIDQARCEFYKLHSGVSFYSPKYRHIMLDSSIAEHEACADIICSAAKNKFRLK